MPIAPLPSTIADLAELTPVLDALTHGERLAWAYGLDESEQLALYALAHDQTLSVDDLVGNGQEVVIHPGRNGLPLFNRFEKRFARLGDEVVGYNHNDTIGGPLNFLVRRLIGPGHFLAYDTDAGEVWIDYRRIPSRRHPDFPTLVDNDHGVRALVFGNMVDVLRRASANVYIGNAYKDKSAPRTWLSTLGSRLPTAPFVLVRPT
jgi:hypothetical protein